MLKRFEVSGFRGFEDNFVLDLAQKKHYAFNNKSVKNGVIKTAIIYGRNGVGKSNLSHAILDLVTQFIESGKENPFFNRNYLNANNKSGVAKFKYVLKFDDDEVEYAYSKESSRKIICEELKINGQTYIAIDRAKSNIATILIQGTETLNTDFTDSGDVISIVSYVNNNTRHQDNVIYVIFKKFIRFITEMLFFRSLPEGNSFIGGLEFESKSICADIVERNNVGIFETFLNNNGVKCSLIEYDSGNNQKDIAFKFDNTIIPFYQIASTGTKSLGLLFFWWQRINEKALICIDEFDAFYHSELSSRLLEMLRDSDVQVILTTHNTGIMSNDYLRPDCYFEMDEKKCIPLSERTNKDLREVHNLEKIYKSGGFRDE